MQHTITISNPFGRLYAHTDAERFPAAHEVTEERPSTLFYADFKVAEAFGLSAVRDTYRNCGDLAKREWKELVELVVVLNHLGWDAYGKGKQALADFYFKKYREADAVAQERIGDDEAKSRHYFEVTD